MVSWLVRSVRPLVGMWLVAALLVAGGGAAWAQGAIDPNFDNDGDGTPNNRDPDDDNDGVYDDQDYYPLDPTRSQKEENPAPTPTPKPAVPDPPPAPSPTPTPMPAAPPAPRDTDNDGDGIVDRVDPDDDNDGIVDEQDSHPFDSSRGEKPTPSIIDTRADDDGDGIVNSHDPDDDNDGVQDDQDSHPFDPTRGEKPPPSIIDPRADSDGDGIANSHDPDDDNDGVVDELDCAPFDATIGLCQEVTATSAAEPTPGATGRGDNDGRGGSSGGRMLVTSLPSTGSGDAQAVTAVDWVLTVIGVVIVAGAMLTLAGLRGWLRPMRVPNRAGQRR